VKPSATTYRTAIVHGLSGVVGVAYVIVVSRLFGPNSAPPFPPLFFVSFLSTGVAGFMLGWRATTIWTIGLFTFAGICGAVVANVIYDAMMKHIDHNLFPFEIAVFAFFAMPGLIGGLVLARSIDREHELSSRPPTKD
jgi:hypothetical protein